MFYEDVKFILNIVMGFLFYLLPIIYFAENIFFSSRIPPALRWWAYHLYLANPLAWIITAFKQIFFGVQNIANVNAPPVLQRAVRLALSADYHCYFGHGLPVGLQVL